MTGFNKMENLISKSTSGIISTQEIFAENISREILNKYIQLIVLGKMIFFFFYKNIEKASTPMILHYIY